jgi:hypothetical protein
MKNRALKRILGLLLTFSLVSGTMGATAGSDDAVMSENHAEFEQQIQTLAEKDIPEVVSREHVEEKGHIKRLYEKEGDDLTTLYFANEDGTESNYLFAEAVKYIDENGKIADKSNKLFSDFKNERFADYAYVNLENDIRTYFPKTLSSKTGVALEYNGRAVSMYPATDIKADVYTENNIVYYDGSFGKDPKLRYEPLFSGFKEDIILDSYVGNEFRFILETDGLIPEMNNEGGINLVNAKTEEKFAMISPIYVYDSFKGEEIKEGERHTTWDNTLEFKLISDDKYELIITVDDEFLKNPDTVYPVYVDPTIYAEGTGANKNILDTPIYNGPSVPGSAGGNTTAVLGYVSSSYGSGRLLMSFPGLTRQPYMNYNHTITDAQLKLWEVSGGAARSNIYVYNYNGTDSWDEGSTYSASRFNGIGTQLDWWWFEYPSLVRRSFNITSAANTWRTNDAQAKKGIILRNTTSESVYANTKTFYTSESGVTTTDKPYLVVTYTSPTTISVGNSYNNTITSGGSFWYRFVPTSTGTYIFETTGSTDTFGELHIGTSTTPTLTNDDGGTGSNFRISCDLTAGVEYFLKVRGYSTSTTGSFSLTLARMPNPNAQNKTMWCWAAASKMVGERSGGNGALNVGATALTNTGDRHSFGANLFFGQNGAGNFTADAGQRQIVWARYSNDNNNGGTTADKEAALQLASFRTMTVDTIGAQNDNRITDAQIITLRNELTAGRWVVGSTIRTAGGTGHSIVVRTYTAATDTYGYWDPWTNTTGTFTGANLTGNAIRLVSDTTNNRTLRFFHRCQ